MLRFRSPFLIHFSLIDCSDTEVSAWQVLALQQVVDAAISKSLLSLSSVSSQLSEGSATFLSDRLAPSIALTDVVISLPTIFDDLSIVLSRLDVALVLLDSLLSYARDRHPTSLIFH